MFLVVFLHFCGLIFLKLVRSSSRILSSLEEAFINDAWEYQLIHLYCVQGGCRTGMAKVTKAYDLPARFV